MMRCVGEFPDSQAPPFLFRPDKARAVAVVRHGARTVGPDIPGLRIDAQDAVGGQRHQYQFARRRFNPLEVLRRAGLAGHKRHLSILTDRDIVSARSQSDAAQPAIDDLEPRRDTRSQAPTAGRQSGRRVKRRQPDRSAIGNGPWVCG